MAMYATKLTLPIIPRVQHLPMVTVPHCPIPGIRTEDKSGNRRNTGLLRYSNLDTRCLPSEPGCNSSYSYALAIWARSVRSLATKRYTTCFDATRCLRYFQIA